MLEEAISDVPHAEMDVGRHPEINQLGPFGLGFHLG